MCGIDLGEALGIDLEMSESHHAIEPPVLVFQGPDPLAVLCRGVIVVRHLLPLASPPHEDGRRLLIPVPVPGVPPHLGPDDDAVHQALPASHQKSPSAG